MQNQLKDPGLGQKFEKTANRAINKDGSFNVKRVGFGYSFKNTYQTLIKISWIKFLILILVFMISINFIFTLFYLLAGANELVGVNTSTEIDLFLQIYFFSFQTFTTVGYGSIAPVGNISSLIASLEAMIGLISFAIVTGILYGRFSRATARFQYSKNALIAPYKDGWSLQFRIANQRNSQIIEMEAKVMMIYTEPNGESHDRKFFMLDLETDNLLFFPLNWTLVHPITSDSPLFGNLKDTLSQSNMEILILIKGFDDTFGQVVHSRYSYTFDEIEWGAKFVRPYFIDDNGEMTLDSSLLDKYDKVSFSGIE